MHRGMFGMARASLAVFSRTTRGIDAPYEEH